MGSGSRSSSSSSGEEDGDADWKAAINSVADASTTYGRSTTNGLVSVTNHTGRPNPENQVDVHKSPSLKLYQVKAQKLLDDILEKSIELVREPIHVPDNGSVINEGGVRLFRDAPPGILFDHVDELQGPTKRPRIVPGKAIDEKSKKFRRQLQSVAVGGEDIIASARVACQKSLAKLEAREEAAKAAAKREEERVAELKKIRGERWLLSIARDMKEIQQRRGRNS